MRHIVEVLEKGEPFPGKLSKLHMSCGHEIEAYGEHQARCYFCRDEEAKQCKADEEKEPGQML